MPKNAEAKIFGKIGKKLKTAKSFQIAFLSVCSFRKKLLKEMAGGPRGWRGELLIQVGGGVG